MLQVRRIDCSGWDPCAWMVGWWLELTAAELWGQCLLFSVTFLEMEADLTRAPADAQL